MNYVSFSLFGTDPKYHVGAIRNAEQIRQYYPGFVPLFYLGPGVPGACIEKLKTLGARFLSRGASKIANLKLLRFAAIEEPDAEIVLVRDTDSRFSYREADAVKQWIESDKLFHVMRDYTGHNMDIPGGMWGWKKELGTLGIYDAMLKWSSDPNGDQHFLSEVIWPKIKHSVMQHDTFSRGRYPGAMPFPGGDESNSGFFVGEVVDENETPQKYVRQARRAGKQAHEIVWSNELCEPFLTMPRERINEGTLVAVCGYGPQAPPKEDWAHDLKGDAFEIESLLPFYEHHQRPIVILSPADAPILSMGRHHCRHAGRRGYIGQITLDRQREYLKILLSYPEDLEWFLLHDSDSVCLYPRIRRRLYEDRLTVWSNEVFETRPHKSPLPKVAMQPPYFFSRDALAKMLDVADGIVAHPITPYVDHYMLQLVCAAGLNHLHHGVDKVTDGGMKHPVNRASLGNHQIYEYSQQR